MALDPKSQWRAVSGLVRQACRNLERQDEDWWRRFESMRARFSSMYNKLRIENDRDSARFVSPIWVQKIRHIEKKFLPLPLVRFPSLFLNQEMSFDLLAPLLKSLEDYFNRDELLRIFRQDALALKAVPLIPPYFTDIQSVCDLYGLVRFQKTTDARFGEINSVIEWGGGYGNLARLFHVAFQPSCTYIIIDLPLVSCIQWLYLGAVLGEQHIHLLEGPGDVIIMGKINLISIGFLKNLSLYADLFISTFALTESSPLALEYVIAQNWFNSRSMLLAGFEEDASSRAILETAQRNRWVIERPVWQPPQYYVFK